MRILGSDSRHWTRIGIGAVFISFPALVFGQNFSFSEEPSSGSLVVDVSSASPYGVATFSTFGFSRGAYHNGVVSGDTSLTCETVPLGGQSPQIVAQCLYYTGDCESCPPDPDTSSSETSCWCREVDPAWSTSDPLKFISSGSSDELKFELHTDTDHDGSIDQNLYSDPSMNPSTGDQMRAASIGAEMAIIEWEDIPQAPNGDYNDVMYYVQGR